MRMESFRLMVSAIKEEVENTGRKFPFSVAFNPVAAFNTVTGAMVAPEGTVTVRLVADGDPVMVALVAPKYTVSSDAVVLKFVPVIVTVVPGVPVFGLTVVIVGGGVGKPTT